MTKGDAADLLFELATADRLTILTTLEQTPMKLTHVAKTLSATVQATSRQLERLHQAKLIEKNVESCYQLTPYGALTISLLPAFTMLHREKEYLLSHDLSVLPDKLLLRIGQLLEHHKSNDVDSSLKAIGSTFMKAQRYVLCVTDPLGASLTYHTWQPNPQKLEYRLILPYHIQFHESVESRARSYLPAADHELRFLNQVKTCIVMNETTAVIAFPNFEGSIDYSSVLIGTKPDFHQWCYDLFNVYWNKAEKLPLSLKVRQLRHM